MLTSVRLRNFKALVDEVAPGTSSERLVVEEPDYTGRVTGFLSEHGIRVMDCAAAQSEIDRPFP